MTAPDSGPPGTTGTEDRARIGLLLALTAVTGLIDAAAFLGLGHLFTANMTGNVVLLAFAIAGAPGLSAGRCSAALAGFVAGALAGGGIATRLRPGPLARWAETALCLEALLILAASAIAAALGADPAGAPVYVMILLTAIAMGLRSATVRALGVPDLTTTVLTQTITGLAADSSLAGGRNLRWTRRLAAVLAMAAGGVLGAILMRRSLAWPLAAGGAITVVCAIVVQVRSTEGARRPGLGS